MLISFCRSENDMGRVQTVLAARERRKARRYGVEVNAHIKVDNETAERHCMIHDISQTGALISVDDGDSLKDFTLTVSRRCRVIRRNKDGSKIGAEFLLP